MSKATTLTGDLFGRAKGIFGRESPAKQAPGKKAANPWHAVSIVACNHACAEARRLEGKRFLSREAPVLPLKSCNRAACQCRYVHHEARRKGPRRARDYGVSIAAYEEGPDMRQKSKRGRRSSDR